MNTLSLPENKIASWQELRRVISSMHAEDASYPKQIEGLQGALYSFFLAEYARSSKKDMVIIAPSEKDVQEIAVDLRTFNIKREILTLPWWGTVPYRSAAKGSVVFGERASVLAKLAESSFSSDDDAVSGNTVYREEPRIFIIPQRAFQTPVPDPEYERKLIFKIKKGVDFDPIKLSERLAEQGYIRVPRVTVRGEFTVRGEVLDIFMPGEETAHRIVFDFDTIEQIRTFDPMTQSTKDSLDSLIIYPMKEILWTDELVNSLEPKLEPFLKPVRGQDDTGELMVTDEDAFRQAGEQLLTELMAGRESEGEELYYPLVFDEVYTILDYLRDDIPVFYMDFDRLANSQESFDREYLGMYRKERLSRPVPPPQTLLRPFSELSPESGKHQKSILFRTIHGAEGESDGSRTVFNVDPPHSFFGNISFLKESVSGLLADGWDIFVYAESDNQALRVEELLRDYPDVTVLPKQLSAGFGIPDIKLLVIQENEIFGRRKRTPHSLHKAKSAVIDTFVELNPGDYVVHVNYGIGLFKGIERVKALGNERDYIKLEYADEEIVFIPIEQVNLVQRYIGNEGNAPKLDRIGSKSWENRKNKVKSSVEDIAEKLILLYSKRKAARGYAFPKDTEWQTAFEAAFPYTETDDQITVAKEIKEDMEKPVPMDRLVCGDVGYGKTEMAMRACFKAVMGGKQVAFMAPTTLLAEQHYESFQNRFQSFPVRIAMLSRFVGPKEQKKTLERLAKGEVDILIGTHRIIQKDVIFKNLGLMVIDEEQRFGVKDKEKLKELKTNIDYLAMSATPIPRTLHMSMLKIRDMSLLTTPPQNRHPIETVIDAYNDDKVAAAIRREVERGGQIFYLHNRVEDLDEVRIKLEKLVPEMLIDVAHGQMTSQELDDIFRRFKMGGFHILVATTIIENGIDIPNVNTIIIDRADMYGVSQLYQLRGRVGRSDRVAYAYLFYPENRALSEIAMKRLQVISDFTDLGSGFKIAMKDMEIRGAGNLLGRDQSGNVYSVGFDMYLRLLEEAVQRLTDENYQPENEVLLELEYTGFIPETYIKNPQTKMEIYKKIASISTKYEYDAVYNELEDRFGPVPDEVYSLLALAEIRIICRQLNISTLKERMGQVQIEFTQVANISIDKALRLIKESNGGVRLDPARPNVMILKTGKIGLREKSVFIREKLMQLA